MKKHEVAELLAICAGFDQRTVGKADVEAWYAVIREEDFKAARARVLSWYANSRERIMPADVLGGYDQGWNPW